LFSAIPIDLIATPTLTPTNRPQTSKNRKYERVYFGNYHRERIEISDLDSVALNAAQVCYANMTRPETAQTSRPHNLYARKQILTEMY